jgi:hypothetical protein
LADNKAKVEATLRFINDTTIVTDIDIHHIMFVFDWFIVNIMDTNFAWVDFTRAVYVAYKRGRAVAKAAKTSTPSVTKNTPVSSTFDFSDDVLLADANHQATPPTPGTTSTLNLHKLWKSPFVAASRNSPNVRKLHNMDLILALSKPLDVIEFYRTLVPATKPAEIELIPFAQFDSDCALWSMNRCAEIVFEMNDVLAPHLGQTGTLNLDDETINILYQKHITDSTIGICAYAFLHAPAIDQATLIGSFGANLERYYLQLSTIIVTFEDKIKSWFFISALQQKGVEVDIFVDSLDNTPYADPLPDELTLTELILKIKDIRSLQNSSATVINDVSRVTQSNDASTPRYSRPPPAA